MDHGCAAKLWYPAEKEEDRLHSCQIHIVVYRLDHRVEKE
jgi:hypothetical protein